MSIASQITALGNNIGAAYNMIGQRGGTIPARKNAENMATAIATIPSGGGGSVGVPREIDSDGVFKLPTTSTTFSLPNTAVDLGYRALYYALQASPGLTSANLNSLTKITGESALYYTFYSCPNLTSISFSSLKDITGTEALYGVCSGCSSLTTVDLSSLETVKVSGGLRSAFQNCTSLTTVNLSSLKEIDNGQVMQYTFRNTGITTMSFPSLIKIGNTNSGGGLTNAFYNCASLTSLYFPALNANSFGSFRTQFNKMLTGCSGVTVHFPAALQSVIGSWSDVTAGFGGTNTTVLFDL